MCTTECAYPTLWLRQDILIQYNMLREAHYSWWQLCLWYFHIVIILWNINKSAQSNFGRGPHCGTVTHVCRKAANGYNSASKIHPQKYPFPWTDRQTELSASSLDLCNLWRQTASGSNPPFFHNELDRPTHKLMHRCTDRSSMRKFGHYRPLRSNSNAA